MDAGQVIHTALTIAALVVALRAFSEVRALREELESTRTSAGESP